MKKSKSTYSATKGAGKANAAARKDGSCSSGKGKGKKGY